MHGIILHEDFRGRMKKLGPERLGKLVLNMFKVDDGEEPDVFPDDEVLDVISEMVIRRLEWDLKQSNNGSKGGAPKGNQNARKQPKINPKSTQKQPKINPKSTQKQPKINPKTTQNQAIIEISNSNKELVISNSKENNKESDPFVEDVISYLNFKTGRHYKVTNKAVGLIHGRLNEGYTAEDFKKVIDKKVKDWMGTDYEKYIQPTTLFAPSHFDSYLNQPEKQSEEDMFSAFLKGGSHGEDVEGRVYSDSQDYESSVC